MTPLDTNGWPPHAVVLSAQMAEMGERIARLEANTETIATRIGTLPCTTHAEKLAALGTLGEVNKTKIGFFSLLSGAIGGALSILAAWIMRQMK